MTEPIISVSGLRGIVGESLTPLTAATYAAAFASTLDGGPIVISRDGRPSGPMIAEVLGGVLRGAGHAVYVAGVAATPTTGVLVRALGAAGGIQISASHNPPEYNGLKLFSAEGRVIPAAAGEAVLERYHNRDFLWATNDRIQIVEPCQSGVEEHLALVLNHVAVDRLRRRRFNVLLDANHGAGSLLGERLLHELGCSVTVLGGRPDGRYEHTPEPTAANLEPIAKQIFRESFDIGFCQDPDADRLAIIDHTGRYIGEEYTLALCLDHVLRRRKGPIVTNCATSRMAFDIAAKHGVKALQSAVGEANVVDLMIESEAVFGGEGNGGPIDPRVGFVRDSFVGMALVLDSMAETGQPVAKLTDALPRYEIVKSKAPLAKEKLPAVFDALESHYSAAASNRQDGLRLDFDDRWLLVRASNTEPIVRVIAEAPDRAAAEALVSEATGIVERA